MRHRRAGLIIAGLVAVLATAFAAPAAASTSAAAAASAAAAGAPCGPVPVSRAHAHNDYEHAHPLTDALDQGFTSVEADVWLVDGQLLMAHDLDQVQPGRTLESLYLRPLADRVGAEGGSVYRGWHQTLHLLIDVKSDATPTYRAIDAALAPHGDLLTTFTGDHVRGGAVTATISGNRDLPAMTAQKVRHAAYDGRLTDLNSPAPVSLIPLISDNWTTTVTWNGVGAMPAAQRARLREIVATAHADGRRVRFWETPDDPGAARFSVCREELAAGVDMLNTDHLTDLATFLRDKDPHPSTPDVAWWPPVAGSRS